MRKWATSCASLFAFQKFRPVENYSDRIAGRRGGSPLVRSGCKRVGNTTRQSGPPSLLRNQKSLTVCRDGIELEGGNVCASEWGVDRKQHVRNARLNRRSRYANVDGKDVGRKHEIQFLSVTAPSRKVPAIGRNLPFAWAFWERLDVDFVAARFVGAVSDPFSIR